MILFIFYFFLLISSIFMVSVVNPVNAVLFLIGIFFHASIIFIILNVDFIGLLFLMVYVGAIAVLFLFIVMMLNIHHMEKDRSLYFTIGGFLVFFYFIQFFFVVFYHYNIYIPYIFFINLNFDFFDYFFLDEYSRFFLVKKIGVIIYQNFFVFLVYISYILYIAMTGSIYLTNEKQGYSMKTQHYQLSRNYNIINVIL